MLNRDPIQFHDRILIRNHSWISLGGPLPSLPTIAALFPGRAWLTPVLALLLLALSLSSVSAQKLPPRANASAADALFTNEVVHLLRIEIPPAGLRGLRHDAREYVRATVREGDTVYTNVLVRLKGGAGSFRPVDDKPGLTLRMDEAGAAFHGLKKFHLNNSVQDETYLSEWLCSDLFRQAGVPAPRALPVLVELNRRRLGLYVLLESVDPPFLSRSFTNTHGNLYSPPGNTDITERLECIGGRETNNIAHLKALAGAARNPASGRLPQALDVDRFLSYMALEVMLCHWDGYTSNVKNYLVYHDVDAQRMVFIPHDIDQMLQTPNWPVLPRAKGVVSRAILADPATRKRYLQRFSEIHDKYFVAPTLTKRLDRIAKQLAPGIQQYDAALGRSFSINARNLRERVLARARFLQGQFGESGSQTQ